MSRPFVTNWNKPGTPARLLIVLLAAAHVLVAQSVITSAVINTTTNTITISGSKLLGPDNVGVAYVSLLTPSGGTIALILLSSSTSSVNAAFPAGTLAALLPTGTYTVQMRFYSISSGVAGTLVQFPLSVTQQTTIKWTSGPFVVAPNAAAVDWAVTNNDTNPVDLRVTVYKLDLLGAKVAVVPGPLTFSLDTGKTFHNANNVGTVFSVGFYYEVVVESSSDNVQAIVDQWSSAGFIPGTLISAGQFVHIR